MKRLKAYLRRWFLSFIDVASIDEFDAKDQGQIDDWLRSSLQHRGFQAYLRSRDRALVQTMLKTPIESESQRREYYEYVGQRIANTRLLQRAEAAANKKNST